MRKDNTPCIRQGLDGLYHICRNNKWGVVDEHLHVIIPFKYSHICYCDENDLFLVVNYDNNPHHGLVNKQGKEQVPLIYEEIKKNSDGTYRVQKDGEEYTIDKNGNRIE